MNELVGRGAEPWVAQAPRGVTVRVSVGETRAGAGRAAGAGLAVTDRGAATDRGARLELRSTTRGCTTVLVLLGAGALTLLGAGVLTLLGLGAARTAAATLLGEGAATER
jgi:hypothetical protein